MTRSQLMVTAALAAGCIAAGDIAGAQAPASPNPPGLTTRRLEFNNVTTNAPYSADFTSTVTQVLADGTRIQQSATGKVYRDSAGRMRREQQVLGLSALTPGTNPVPVVTITDPTTRTTYTINDQARTATQAPYARALEYELPFGWPGAANWTVPPGTNELRAVRLLSDQLDQLRVRQPATAPGLDAGQGGRQGGGRGGVRADPPPAHRRRAFPNRLVPARWKASPPRARASRQRSRRDKSATIGRSSSLTRRGTPRISAPSSTRSITIRAPGTSSTGCETSIAMNPPPASFKFLRATG